MVTAQNQRRQAYRLTNLSVCYTQLISRFANYKSDQRLLFLLDGWRDKKIRLLLRLLNALTGDVKILLLAFDPDKRAAHLHSCYACSTAAHEWI